ncbi:hypothetical protein FKZ61_004865 [Litorilinea aerophila]|uniref:Transcriptional regulator n=1 Tax=Litorilinea aerophila TaxID=1204385 RepID=A0A540VJR7_9CHLR|nr:hypothetical protein [Litorilinea aerophila]MCC9075442.1 hypothetical protein [Litorilinea aerophila]GIV76324.1 MAG: hypothetical protein KatS3mg050_0718 [Litorilinea sp.]GIV77348.1 MAG: hypothetical protein KatS3mg050_1742 [Litorilinea sp.]GIV80491.1 MAG: hypothetical protein KatS3mg050_4885 [Litorilinea sp.]
MTSEALNQIEARERYRRSVTRAQVADLLGLITGQDTDLINYHEIANRLKARQQIEKGTEMVPLDRIVGSVGRYRDFTRTFLPRSGVNEERWTRVDAAMHSLEGLPPVELFKIGEVYFVKDGNHRVSVARANGMTHIEAYVTEVATDIPLTLDDFERDRWLIKVEEAEFLEKTKINELVPDHGISLTEPGRYEQLIHHIQVHQYLRNLDLDREGKEERLSWEDAVVSWYRNVYQPVVEAIRKYNLLEHFPERTEADLYLWIAHHRERLAAHYGLAPLSPEAAVSTFAELHSERPLERTVKGLRLGLLRVLGQDDIPPGMSEEEFLEARARHDAGEISLAEAAQRQEEGEDTEAEDPEAESEPSQEPA